METILLSADGEISAYTVPDIVENKLEEYCLEFCDWLESSNEAKYFRKCGGLCFNEKDFIDYLNKYKFPNEKSYLIETLFNVYSKKHIPHKYKKYKLFNF